MRHPSKILLRQDLVKLPNSPRLCAVLSLICWRYYRDCGTRLTLSCQTTSLHKSCCRQCQSENDALMLVFLFNSTQACCTLERTDGVGAPAVTTSSVPGTFVAAAERTCPAVHSSGQLALSIPSFVALHVQIINLWQLQCNLAHAHTSACVQFVHNTSKNPAFPVTVLLYVCQDNPDDP